MSELVKVNVQILCRSDESSNWTAQNPILGKGEPGYELDTTLLKIGDGVTTWNDLPYINQEHKQQWGVF